jgi:hypothetical protein
MAVFSGETCKGFERLIVDERMMFMDVGDVKALGPYHVHHEDRKAR